jgi:hypothetical protein
VDWSEAQAIPGPSDTGGSETQWVVPEKFFDQLGGALDTVPPLPGEEALFGQFRVLLDAAAKDPAIKQALVEVPLRLSARSSPHSLSGSATAGRRATAEIA